MPVEQYSEQEWLNILEEEREKWTDTRPGMVTVWYRNVKRALVGGVE